MKSELIPKQQFQLQITMETDEANELAKDLGYALRLLIEHKTRLALYSRLEVLRNLILGTEYEKQSVLTLDNKTTP